MKSSVFCLFLLFFALAQAHNINFIYNILSKSNNVLGSLKIKLKDSKRRFLMEEMVKKIVNLGIGAGKVVEENAQKVMNDIGNQINELIAKGEGANDDVSTKIKNFVEEAASNVGQIVENSTSSANEVFGQVKKTTDELIGNLKNLVGSDNQ